MTELVLLGAGASFGSGAAHPEQLPLGRDLFERLVAFSKTWRDLPQEAAAEFRRDQLFEHGFVWICEHMDEASMGLLRDMALYFLQFRPLPGNIYPRFVAACRGRGDVQLATLNYDILLDLCVGATQGGAVRYGRNRDGLLYLLPIHGSPLLLPDMPADALQGCYFAGNAVNLDAPMRWHDPDTAAGFLRATDTLSPGMALYAPGKRVMVSPGRVVELQQSFRDVCAEATRIYLCGLSHQPHDMHVWNPIVEAQAPVVVADPNVRAFDQLRDAIGERLTVMAGGFDEFVRQYESGHV